MIRIARWAFVGALFLALHSSALARPDAEPASAANAPSGVNVPAIQEGATRPELVRPTDLVTAQRGTLPIILSAPHGGGARVPGAVERKSDGSYALVTVRDTSTEKLTLLIAQRITERLNAKPSYVIAQFSRKDVDANRERGDAAENNAGLAQYDAYHGALATLVREAKARHGERVLLLDIHGQGVDRDVIYRGTRDGLTCSRLLEREGAAGLVGEKSFLGLLAKKGYRVLPAVGAEDMGVPTGEGDAEQNKTPGAAKDAPRSDPSVPGEPSPPKRTPRGATKWTNAIGHEERFNGGYIVAHYGSQNADGVDAIQLEFGGRLRDDEMVKTARAVGDAIVEWVKEHQ